MSASLGRLEKVDLRTVWNNEAYDFTPWLAQEENLELLGDTIGIELELDGTEKNVGPFNADILCRDTVEDQWVLLENQLERTDHTHLGQLLTYAAGLHAVTVVWVSARFTEEHRAALDWLNEITEEGINFFGLEIELWCIGDSPIAPKFNMVSKPNDWSKKVADAARRDGELSELQQLYLEYWTEFHDYVQENGERVIPRSPNNRHWMDFAVGRSHCNLAARVSDMKSAAEVDLMLKGEDGEAFFHLLKQERRDIESQISAELIWDPNPEKKSFMVRSRWEGVDPADKTDWARQHGLLCKVLDEYHAAFAPRLKQLDVSDYTPEPEAQEELS